MRRGSIVSWLALAIGAVAVGLLVGCADGAGREEGDAGPASPAAESAAASTAAMPASDEPTVELPGRDSVGAARSEGSGGSSSAAEPGDPVARRPNLEGIPNWEDVVSLREGDWLIVLGSWRIDAERGERPGPGHTSTVTRASDERVAARQQALWNADVIPWAIRSDLVPRLEPGLTVLVTGPYPRELAEQRMAALREIVPDAYIKRGW